MLKLWKKPPKVEDFDISFGIAQCAPRGQYHLQNSPQLVFLMLPTSPASLVDFRQFLIFLIPMVPPLDNF